jgi:hypothetical protein
MRKKVDNSALLIATLNAKVFVQLVAFSFTFKDKEKELDKYCTLLSCATVLV